MITDLYSTVPPKDVVSVDVSDRGSFLQKQLNGKSFILLQCCLYESVLMFITWKLCCAVMCRICEKRQKWTRVTFVRRNGVLQLRQLFDLASCDVLRNQLVNMIYEES